MRYRDDLWPGRWIPPGRGILQRLGEVCLRAVMGVNGVFLPVSECYIHKSEFKPTGTTPLVFSGLSLES